MLANELGLTRAELTELEAPKRDAADEDLSATRGLGPTLHRARRSPGWSLPMSMRTKIRTSCSIHFRKEVTNILLPLLICILRKKQARAAMLLSHRLPVRKGRRADLGLVCILSLCRPVKGECLMCFPVTQRRYAIGDP